MKYQCPSCHLQWSDAQKPRDLLCTPLCVFCSLNHTQKELLNWQSDHIENLDPKKIPIVIRHIFRYFELELTTLKEEVYGKKEKEERDDG